MKTLLIVTLLAGALGVEAAWFKGNTHAHSRTFVKGIPHGDSTARLVAKWYSDEGYDFIVISAHNKFVDPRKVKLSRKSSLLLIPGMEVTSDYRFPGSPKEGQRSLHSTAIGIRHPVDWNYAAAETPSAVLQRHVDGAVAAGGLAIINHPNYRWQLTVDDLLAVHGWSLMEIYNAHPASKNFGKPQEGRSSVEEMWDQLLTRGRRIYGVAADDAHAFADWKRHMREYGLALPGGAWIMVQAPQLESKAILSALRDGDFYASTGVHLSELRRSYRGYHVAVDAAKTVREMAKWHVREAAPEVQETDHLRIEFIGDNGKVLESTDQPIATLSKADSSSYVRARVRLVKDGRVYFAWTQPAFAP